jgi:nucleotide-binding universal stress UspA family protein
MEVAVRVGKAPVEIVREVVAGKYDLLVKTADGNSSLNRLFGSTAQTVMRTCPCPVWIFKPEVHGSFDQILTAIDVDTQDAEHAALNQRLLSLAHSIAVTDEATLHVVAAYEVWMEQSLRRRAGDAEVDQVRRVREQRVRTAIEQLLRDEGLVDGSPAAVRVEVHVHAGTPGLVIGKVAEKTEADLLVMGTVCRTGVAGFLIGNTAEQVLAEATCSVLALKPKGFVTPITAEDGGTVDT